jgi:hypothetical protein
MAEVKTAGRHPSVAKANRFLSAIYGTAEALLLHDQAFTKDC